jgi:hypothetical protein
MKSAKPDTVRFDAQRAPGNTFDGVDCIHDIQDRDISRVVQQAETPIFPRCAWSKPARLRDYRPLNK